MMEIETEADILQGKRTKYEILQNISKHEEEEEDYILDYISNSSSVALRTEASSGSNSPNISNVLSSKKTLSDQDRVNEISPTVSYQKQREETSNESSTNLNNTPITTHKEGHGASYIKSKALSGISSNKLISTDEMTDSESKSQVLLSGTVKSLNKHPQKVQRLDRQHHLKMIPLRLVQIQILQSLIYLDSKPRNQTLHASIANMPLIHCTNS